MKILAAFFIPMSICAFFYGAFWMVDSTTRGKFYPEALVIMILGLVLGALAALFFWLSRRKNNKISASKAPTVPKSDILERLERRNKNGRHLLVAMLILGGVVLLGAGGVVLGVQLDNAMIKLISSVFICFDSLVAILVLFGIYMAKCHPLKKNQKLLERLGVTMEYCLEGVGEESATVVARVIVAEHALVFEKEGLVLPYASIGWIFRRMQYINGVHTSTSCAIYTVYGSSFEVVLTSEFDFRVILGACGHKLPADVVLGYGKQQKKAYAALKKEYKDHNRV